jgi:hypothetical protein
VQIIKSVINYLNAQDWLSQIFLIKGISAL